MKNKTQLSLIPKATTLGSVFDALTDQIWKDFDVFASPSEGRIPYVTTFRNWEELEDKFSTEVEIPRFTKDDIRISVENDMLHISAEKDNKYRFYHTMNIPSMADQDKPEAKLDHGILTVSFSKLESAKAKTIEIK